MDEDELKATGSGRETSKKAGTSGRVGTAEKGVAKCRECGARDWEMQPLDRGIVIVYCSWCDVALGCVTV